MSDDVDRSMGGQPAGRGSDGPFEDRSRVGRRRGGRVDRIGRPRMADLTGRPTVPRRAVAEAEVAVSHQTLSAIVDGSSARGDVLSVAELAGVMAAKRTAELIPLSHSTALTELRVTATPERAAGVVRIRAETAAQGPSDVEMEALTAAGVAALTVYDMVRGEDRSAFVGAIRLVSTSEGGEAWQRPPDRTGAARRPPAGARGAGRISRPGQRGPANRPTRAPGRRRS
jgi:cyclic pyranopterin phosphate synthase